MPWRVYRPAIVVGNSETGEMDKIDGPYYFFTAIKMARHYLPGWFPLIGPELGYTNIVPVDFVADAHGPHRPRADGLDGQAFHLTSPKSQRSGEVMNTIAAAAHAPQIRVRIDSKLLKALPKGTIGMLMQLPGGQGRAQGDPGRLRDPRRGARLHRADRASSTPGTPSGPWPARASRCRRWRATPPSSGTTGSATSIRTCSRTAASRARSTARRC